VRILLLTHSFNSLTQRLFEALAVRGHEVSVEFDIADSVTEEAVALFAPDVIVAPFLKRAVPESIWRRHLTLIVHPGIIGDRGPSALDWAIQEAEPAWGVTVLQAEAEMDAGPVWASREFPLRAASKADVYRNETTAGALAAVRVGPGGVLERAGVAWRWGIGGVRVRYTHGYDAPPPAIRRAALALLAAQLVPSDVSARATQQTTEYGTYNLAVAGWRDRAYYGIPEVDAVLARYDETVPGIG